MPSSCRRRQIRQVSPVQDDTPAGPERGRKRAGQMGQDVDFPTPDAPMIESIVGATWRSSATSRRSP